MAVSLAELTIPDILRDVLRRDGLTQGQLAVKVGVNPSQISTWLAGQARPSIENIVAIAKASGRSEAQVREAAGYPVTPASDGPEIPPWVAETLVKLNEYELRVVDDTARGLLRLREERARYGDQE